MEIECPECLTIFEAETWSDINCPSCGKEGYWDEMETEEDNWEIVIRWE